MSDGRGALLPRRRDPVETLRYSLEAFDGRDNLVEVLGRLADLSVAQVAYDATVAKHSRQAHLPRQTCRVIRSSDRDVK